MIARLFADLKERNEKAQGKVEDRSPGLENKPLPSFLQALNGRHDPVIMPRIQRLRDNY